MTPTQLLHSARDMLGRVAPSTANLWPRCVAFLLREALEGQVARVLDRLAPGIRATPMRTQLIALTVLGRRPELSRRVAYTWHALSQATHYHGYELPAGAADLHAWMTTVEVFLASDIADPRPERA